VNVRSIGMKSQRIRVMRCFSSALLGCWALAPISVLAQDAPGSVDDNSQGLTLFEEVENTAGANNSPNRPAREARATTSEPEFTLIGTSRIGSDYTAMVKHKSGEILLVEAKPSENTAIQDHIDYSIVDIAAGAISVRYPSNNPCVEFSDRGVRCNASGNIAELVLATGEPLPSINPALINRSGDGNDSGEELDDLNTEPANPFEALRNAQSGRAVGAQGGDTTSGGFTPRRISPEDVPAGMRVITTPFGDRLVEQ
jgi:hypothetical protein